MRGKKLKSKSTITKTKILILDESPLMRKIISDIFVDDVSIEIVGSFKNFDKMKKFLNEINFKVDCIVVNIIFDKKDIINILLDIKKYTLNIILVSNIDLDKIDMFKQVLEFKNIKFIEYMNKLNLSCISNVKEEVRKEVYKIKNSRIKDVLFDGKRAIVIAASTGGPKVLEYIFKELEVEINIPIFIVQHMPDGYTKQFVERLNEICNYKFCEGEDGEVAKSNVIYIAPSGYHMQINYGGKIILNKDEFVNNVRPSADVLFCSASKFYKKGLLGIVLTGMGKDASYGVQCIKYNGGTTIAQNNRSCVVFGMPKSAIETGKIDKILSIDEIILEILKHSGKV